MKIKKQIVKKEILKTLDLEKEENLNINSEDEDDDVSLDSDQEVRHYLCLIHSILKRLKFNVFTAAIGVCSK